MTIGHRFAGPLVALALVLSAGPASAEPIMPLSEVRPGMRGYGLTVLRGTAPERFDIEVIDVLHQFLTRQDLILIRMRHPLLEQSGTVGGMSGSPIYLEGRLIGALAYGWFYALEPIAGVTPIETMLGELDRPRRPPAPLGGPLPGPGRVPLARRRGAGLGSPVAEALGEPDPYWRAFRESEGPTPAVTPLLLGGFSARVRALLSDALGEVGMIPVEAGGGGGPGRLPRAGPRPFEPGGALGVQLVRGDLSATAIGTVTTVRGNDVLAFGHPMFNFGQQRWPAVTARILTVLASSRRSFKIGEPVAEAGAMVQDRQPCIIADTSESAPMTPVRVAIDDRTTGTRETFEVEVVRDRYLLPAFTLSSVAAVLERFASDRTDLTVTMRGRLQLPGHGTVALEDHAFTALGTGDAATVLRMRPLAALQGIVANPFEHVVPERLDLEVSLDFRREEAEIVGAYLTTEEPVAGARVAVHVVLRPFSGPEEVRVVPIRIPRSAAGQEIEITVAGGEDTRPPVPEPRDLGDLVRNLQRTFPATSVVVSLTRPSRAVSLRGHVAEHLPPSALDSLRPLAQDALERPLRTVVQVQAPVGRVVEGAAEIRVRVREPEA